MNAGCGNFILPQGFRPAQHPVNVIFWVALTYRTLRISLLAAGTSLLLAGLLPGQALFINPVKILGDPHFTGTAANPLTFDSAGPNVVEGRELNSPEGIAVDNSVSPPYIYIADTANNRVLGFRYSTELTAGSYADVILGQPDRFTTIAGGSGGGPSTALRLPTGLAVDASGNLYVADTGNNRIIRYATPMAQGSGYQFPNMVIGQTSYAATTANQGGAASASTLAFFGSSFAGRTGIAFDSTGNLWVADIGNNRVLRYPASALQAGLNGPAADTALGQPNLTTTLAAAVATSKTGLAAPTGVAFDSKGRLFVTDGLTRGLVYPPSPATNTAALRIMGLESNVSAPDAVRFPNSQGIGTAGSLVLVADNLENRVLVFPSFDAWPAESTQFSPSASQALGQTTTGTVLANQGNGTSSAATLSSPTDIAASPTELFVADTANNRVLVFSYNSSSVTATASRVIGQLDFPDNAPNLVEGKEFNTISTATGFSGSAVLDFSATPPHLYVADTANNRILGYKNFSQAQEGVTADIVIGQPNFTSTEVNYPSGQSTQPNPTGLNQPTALVVDSSGDLYVADALNSRVVRFRAPFNSGMTSLEPADLAIGQSSLTAQVAQTTASTLTAPVALAFTTDGANAAKANSGWLAVADVLQNRVLLFPKPLSTGMNASTVLGQINFTNSGSGSGTAALNLPQGVAVDLKDRILIADSTNKRIQVYPPAGSLAAAGTAPSFALTNSLAGPTGIGMGTAGDFWVADPTNNRLVHFDSIDQLPLNPTPYAPDTAVPAVSPRSSSYDQYGDLLVADGINRIVYFVPQVTPQNAANYLTTDVHALAPGTFTVIYPTASTNVISSGTATNTTLPWSTTLSDTEVVVGGIPAALYYVSPGQINFPLPMALPSGGSVDLQVLRPSTGQIYGAAEIPMALASPALFVLGGLQSGPVAAENQDFSLNSPSNPAAIGTVIQLYGTGEGFVTGAPPEGQASTGALSTSVNPVVLLGPAGSKIQVPPANVQYSGIAPGEIGLWQINVTIPPNAPTGTVPISLLMQDISSGNNALPTEVVTTIAIK
jgi:uncharacterized protein (TIGR03437 family)